MKSKSSRGHKKYKLATRVKNLRFYTFQMNFKAFILAIFASAAAQNLDDSWPDNWPNVAETGLRENPARFMPMVRFTPSCYPQFTANCSVKPDANII